MPNSSARDDAHNEHLLVNQVYGTYADILFVLFPFLVLGLQGLWTGDLNKVLMGPDLSIAAAILAGLSMGRFVMGLISDRNLGRYKERIVFFIALTLFVVLGPAIILVLRISSGEPVPGFVSFAQPILLILAISLYTTAVSVSNILTRSHALESEQERGRDATKDAQEAGSLVLPRRRSEMES